jgi:N-acetylmuramoyl-L-alanine amidase
VKYKPLTDVRYIVVHCAATSANVDVGAKEIDRWHRERGFFSIGYHAVIRRNGTVEDGRPIDQPGAHARQHNSHSLGVCLVGGVDGVDKNRDGRITPDEFVPEANFTPEQIYMLRIVLDEWKAKWPNAEIVGHRDLDSGKACPSFDVKTWIAQGRPDVLPT